jgi:hypothetical protein
MAPFVDDRLKTEIRSFNDRGQLGADPLAARYVERRAGYSLFSRNALMLAYAAETNRGG